MPQSRPLRLYIVQCVDERYYLNEWGVTMSYFPAMFHSRKEAQELIDACGVHYVYGVQIEWKIVELEAYPVPRHGFNLIENFSDRSVTCRNSQVLSQTEPTRS